jgi:hypothetical protein
MSSLFNLGKSYLQTEELSKKTIDCSTLVSQSYWEGAFISVPFIAESHRTSLDAEVIAFSNIKPGDIVIKYKNKESSNDQKHNHVGLVLGESSKGKFYVIESNSLKGCIISSIEEFEPLGGFRKYIKNENIQININDFYKNINIARLIPKLGRLGARQYLKESEERIKHRGIDIYLALRKNIHAPFGGVIHRCYLENENCYGYKIINDGLNFEAILGNIRVNKDILNCKVKNGEIIGHTKIISKSNRIKYTKLNNKTCNLHFQIQGNLTNNNSFYGFKENGIIYYNGLYLSKLNLINLPFYI